MLLKITGKYRQHSSWWYDKQSSNAGEQGFERTLQYDERNTWGSYIWCTACLYVTEFQKRGLPHTHILDIFCPEDKLSETYIANEAISTEVTNLMREPELYELVKSNTVHGPRGDVKPNSACITSVYAKKYYPKQHSDKTYISDNMSPFNGWEMKKAAHKI